MPEEAEVSVAIYLKGLLSCSDPLSDVMSKEPGGSGVEIFNRSVLAPELLEPPELAFELQEPAFEVPTVVPIYFPLC